jgi:hypothetical protein
LKGRIHDYLGIQFNFLKVGKVVMSMDGYISDLSGNTRRFVERSGIFPGQ